MQSGWWVNLANFARMMYPVQLIADVLKADLEGPEPDAVVEHLLLDSRKLIYPESSLFFAIKGVHHNGHLYIDQLIEAGVRNFVIQKGERLRKNPNVNYIEVDNVLDALQAIAGHHREQFAYPVIGITGSNGKTIVKEWLYQLLSRNYRVIRSPKSFNSQVGVPLSLWNMDLNHDIAVIEAGISQPGEMEKLEEIIRPDIGLLTNIGDAHARGFENETQKVMEKLKLFARSKVFISRKEEDRISDLIGFFIEDHPGVEWLSWSTTTEADLHIEEMEHSDRETTIEGDYRGKKVRISIPFTDDASVENAIHCITILLYLQFNEREIQQGIRALQPIEMRLTQREGVNNCLVIDDYYNADVKSLTLAIDFMEQQHRNGQKTVILSDILQSELTPQELYSQVERILSEKGIDRLIGIGEEIGRFAEVFHRPGLEFYRNTEDFLNNASTSQFSDETVLLKGARAFSFERISRWLEKKSHGTVLEINLNAVESNLNYFRSMLSPETKMMVMLKAFGYGSGSHQIAKLLQFNGVDYLAVAYADEGMSLREDGITMPIMVMNPDESSMDLILDYQLQPNIYDFRILDILEDRIASRGPGKVQVHLEFNTGMNRLGFDEEDIDDLLARLSRQTDMEVVSVFSHLAVADEARGKRFTESQIDQFTRIAGRIIAAVPGKPLLHILNTPGLLHYADHQMDMVRLGIGIYGVDPSDRSNDHLAHVSTLKSYISQLRTVQAGEGVSYGCGSVSDSERIIATIPIGYADGFNRKFSNGYGSMRVADVDCEVVGSVCMDMTMIDVTGVECEVGDEVIIFGSAGDLYNMADKLETIPYEILTSISQRVKREYLRE